MPPENTPENTPGNTSHKPATNHDSHFECCGGDGGTGLHDPGCSFNGKVRHLTSSDGTATARAHVAADLSPESEEALQSIVDAAAADMGSESSLPSPAEFDGFLIEHWQWHQRTDDGRCAVCHEKHAAALVAEARIVAWLRTADVDDRAGVAAFACGRLATRIEQGAHRGN